MIRNIQNEKKNLQRCQDSGFSDYLSDEELLKLIGNVEEKEMLRAPAHLKSNVMAKIRRDRHMTRKRQIFAYRAKVLTAMAAALAVLLLMPVDRTESEGRIFAWQQADASLEQMELEHRKDIDANWERYLKERENGGMSGFIRGINEKIAEFEIILRR